MRILLLISAFILASPSTLNAAPSTEELTKYTDCLYRAVNANSKENAADLAKQACANQRKKLLSQMSPESRSALATQLSRAEKTILEER